MGCFQTTGPSCPGGVPPFDETEISDDNLLFLHLGRKKKADQREKLPGSHVIRMISILVNIRSCLSQRPSKCLYRTSFYFDGISGKRGWLHALYR